MNKRHQQIRNHIFLSTLIFLLLTLGFTVHEEGLVSLTSLHLWLKTLVQTGIFLFFLLPVFYLTDKGDKV